MMLTLCVMLLLPSEIILYPRQRKIFDEILAILAIDDYAKDGGSEVV